MHGDINFKGSDSSYLSGYFLFCAPSLLVRGRTNTVVKRQVQVQVLMICKHRRRSARKARQAIQVVLSLQFIILITLLLKWSEVHIITQSSIPCFCHGCKATHTSADIQLQCWLMVWGGSRAGLIIKLIQSEFCTIRLYLSLYKRSKFAKENI